MAASASLTVKLWRLVDQGELFSFLGTTPSPAEGQCMIVLEGNDIPYEDCNAIGAAKRQSNILRDYFMIEGQLPCPMNSS